MTCKRFNSIFFTNSQFYSTEFPIRVLLKNSRLSSYHPNLWIVVCVYLLIRFYLFLSTWASRGVTSFILSVFSCCWYSFRPSIRVLCRSLFYRRKLFVNGPLSNLAVTVRFLPSLFSFLALFVHMRHCAVWLLSDCCVFPSPVWHTDSPFQLVR